MTEKVTKSSVDYRPGDGKERCHNCAMYHTGKLYGSCDLVEGKIAPEYVLRQMGEEMTQHVAHRKSDEMAQANERVIRELAMAIYPILIPLEQQDCAIQARNYARMVEIARKIWLEYSQ